MEETVTLGQWLAKLAQGDQDAAQRIWDRYCGRLLLLARGKLGRRHRRTGDEEDVVLSAFASFCRGIQAGRIQAAREEEDLWRLLVTITARKAVAQLRREHSQKRGGGRVRGQSVFVRRGAEEAPPGIDQVLGQEPTPALAAAVTEECARLLARLEDETLGTIALRKLEGYTNEEIARLLGCSLPTVERKLARIRKKWNAEGVSP
jgi:DNA-directed RNA polymerase specialized sigma24 family protein